jgi:dTDP-4-amino-4,6-dideoxygalactose transaminase
MPLALLGGSPVREAPFPIRPLLTPAEQAEAAAVLGLGSWSTLSPGEPPEPIIQLERAWAEQHSGGEAIAVASGTTALSLALRAVGLAPGDEVIVPAYGCLAPEMAVLEAGGVPIHADIRPSDYCLAAEDVERRISERTRAIVAVHFGGQAADFAALAERSQQEGLWLIEDAALAPGAAGPRGPVGSLGIAAAFSLGVDKPIHAGEGGLILTRDAKLAAHCRALRSFGQVSAGEVPEYDRPGGNYRLTALQAAVALPQLARLEADRRHREENAHRILAALPPGSPLRPLTPAPGAHAWTQLWLRFDPETGVPRPRVVAALQAEGIPAFEGWDRPNYAHRLFTPERAAGLVRACSSPRAPDCYFKTHCPAAERAALEEALLLPLTVLRAAPGDVADVVCALEKLHACWEKLR